MAELARPEVRYTAFLSYSHRDAASAGRLHRRLEAYRLPKRLAGSEAARGIVPDRLWPIFRDREELPAATDLSETVRDALDESGALIVLCSPHSAGSLWVAEEIETFRRLHPDRPILAAILDGDPPGCFPAALRAFGQGGTWHEPLATDLRRGRDGGQLGLLKLVAGITGVGLDALVQRDAARKIRRVTAVTSVAFIAMLIMAALAWFALDARREAERQRAEAERQRAAAEGQIEFMLTDLREKLTGVGRTDIMLAVNQNALRYYSGQRELGGLSADSLERRARVLLAMGADYEERGNQAAALGAFREAHRITTEQLSRAPADPQRIYAHSQSEFYVGNVDLERRNYAAARGAFERYRELADRLIAINPNNADWQTEAAFARGNLCTVLRNGYRDMAAALRWCGQALERMEAAARASRDPASYNSKLANRHAELADTLWLAGRRQQALSHRYRQLQYAEAAFAADRTNVGSRVKHIRALRGVANLEANLGRTSIAVARMSEALRGMEGLTAHDPGNNDWQIERREIAAELTQIRQGRRD